MLRIYFQSDVLFIYHKIYIINNDINDIITIRDDIK